MKRPFDYVGGKPIDIDKPEHRDVVIQRNKSLEYATVNGVDPSCIKAVVQIEVQTHCLKCGTPLRNLVSKEVDNFESDFDLIEIVPNLKCICCGVTYQYHVGKEQYVLRFPKIKIPIKQKL